MPSQFMGIFKRKKERKKRREKQGIAMPVYLLGNKFFMENDKGYNLTL